MSTEMRQETVAMLWWQTADTRASQAAVVTLDVSNTSQSRTLMLRRVPVARPSRQDTVSRDQGATSSQETNILGLIALSSWTTYSHIS